MKCFNCETKIDENNCYSIEWGENEGKTICENCYSDSEQVGSIVAYLNGEKYNITVTDFTVFSDDIIPEIIQDLVNTIKWKSTDGWRGFYECTEPTNYEHVVDTWFCGFDGHNLDDNGFLLEKKLDSEDIPEFDLIVLFLRTSNVFSTGLDVYTKADQKEYLDWLRKD